MEMRLLLSIGKWLKRDVTDEVWQRALAKVDEDKRQRIQEAKLQRRKAELLGGGLLLQYALQIGEGDKNLKEASSDILFLEGDTLLDLLQSPVPAELVYGPAGKPRVKDNRFFFNLSHSGEMVFCAISDEEVGVDIQQIRSVSVELITKRFFTTREQEHLEGLFTNEEKEQAFYRIWCRKEALGKYKGNGIIDVLKEDVLLNKNGCYFEEYCVEDTYYISVCKRSWNA